MRVCEDEGEREDEGGCENEGECEDEGVYTSMGDGMTNMIVVMHVVEWKEHILKFKKTNKSHRSYC